MTRPLYSPAFLARIAASEAERLYLATEAADLAPVTEADRLAAREDNWFTQMHDSDKGIAERSGDPTRGRERGDE